MAYELRDMNGSLFKNKHKTEAKHPDYRGDTMVNGVKLEVAAWIKTDKNGGKFMSLAFTVPRERPTTAASTTQTRDRGPAPNSPSPQTEGWDDDIPF